MNVLSVNALRLVERVVNVENRTEIERIIYVRNAVIRTSVLLVRRKCLKFLATVSPITTNTAISVTKITKKRKQMLNI